MVAKRALRAPPPAVCRCCRPAELSPRAGKIQAAGAAPVRMPSPWSVICAAALLPELDFFLQARGGLRGMAGALRRPPERKEHQNDVTDSHAHRRRPS